MMRAFFCCLVAISISTCNQDAPQGFLWSQKQSSHGKLVWADQINRLYFSGLVSENEFERKKLVMVRIAPGRFDPEYWRSKHNVLALFEPKALEFGRALVAVQSSEEHAELATLAHASGGCGNLDPVDLNLTLQEGTSKVTPPIFHSLVKLDAVASLMNDVNASKISNSIKDIASLGTRMHETASGISFPDKLVTTWTNAGSGLSNFTVETVNVDSSNQDNVVAKLTGTTDPDNVVIIGAHLDSTNASGDYEDAPGADDDGSGIATLTEVIRVLAKHNVTFDRTVEIHGYAAEEFGRLGSTALANRYKRTNKHVAGMFQIDMNAYSTDPKDQTIFFTKEFTNSYLNRLNKNLLQTYLGGDYEEKSLTAGTSDHKSWHQVGAATVFPFEDPDNFNRRLHTPNDNFSSINNTKKAARFAKLALAFLGHHAGLTAAKAEHESALQTKTPESSDLNDLPIAVINSTITGKYYMAVGSNLAVSRVEACKIKTTNAVTCSSHHGVYSELGEQNGRRIFLNEVETELTAGDRFRLYGYDANDKLAFIRNIRLEKS
jgi:leucyl aminopeptidase